MFINLSYFYIIRINGRKRLTFPNTKSGSLVDHEYVSKHRAFTFSGESAVPRI